MKKLFLNREKQRELTSHKHACINLLFSALDWNNVTSCFKFHFDFLTMTDCKKEFEPSNLYLKLNLLMYFIKVAENEAKTVTEYVCCSLDSVCWGHVRGPPTSSNRTQEI